VDLDETVRALAPRVLRYARMRTGDTALAEEVAQESLTALVRRWRTHGPPDFPEAFVFSIARRRAGRAVVRRKLWVPIEELLGARDGHPTPEDRTVAGSERAHLLAGLARLPRRDREALLMVTVSRLSTFDAAKALGISASAVKMRTLRARQRLRALLEDPRDHR
jgi:RNA polymerase sigma-70 factor (ECF subfamily)